MKLYRLTQKKFSATPFSPAGAKLYGGRWNSRGIEALYFAESESLCILEVFVHVKNDPAIVDQYDLYRIEIPDELVATLTEEDLPVNWRAVPLSESTQRIGDQFLLDAALPFVALQVPSAISPRDCNYLVNPGHSDADTIFKTAEKLDFRFDLRIFK